MSQSWWEKDGIDLGIVEGSMAESMIEAGREAGEDIEAEERRGEVE